VFLLFKPAASGLFSLLKPIEVFIYFFASTRLSGFRGWPFPFHGQGIQQHWRSAFDFFLVSPYPGAI